MTLAQRTDDVAATLQHSAQAHPRAALARSFSAEDMVLLDLVSRHATEIRVFTRDTGGSRGNAWAGRPHARPSLHDS
jgi:phosphoadenosine phosphosulfate reductase